jgi:hypothetical protein
MLRFSDVLMVFLAVSMLTLVSVGVANAARRGGRTAPEARRLALSVGGGLVLWLVATAALARAGILAAWTALPPRWPLLPALAFIVIALISRARTTKLFITHTPLHWPIAAQSFRVAVELAIYALHSEGRAPRQITFDGRNFDVFVGLTAPLVAWLVATQRAKPPLVLVWNVAALAVLANTVFTVATSTPGPLHLDWPGAPFTAIASWPVVWLPAFLMPLAVFLHVVSLQQIRSQS